MTEIEDRLEKRIEWIEEQPPELCRDCWGLFNNDLDFSYSRYACFDSKNLREFSNLSLKEISERCRYNDE